MAILAELRASAKALGIPAPEIRGASSEELQALIMDRINGKSTKTKAPARKATTKTTRKPVTRKTTTKPRTSAKSKPAAKSTVGKAKRSTSGTGNGNGSGRHTLTDVDYTVTEGWNARPDSPPDLIVRALRRYNGNREKVFANLVPKIGTFVGAKDSQGRKRSKDNAEAMLKYRISRTAWDFAMKTGQHEKSTDRVEYGTGGGATKKPVRKATGGSRTATKAKTAPRATKKPATRQSATRKPAARKPVAKKKTARR